MGGQDHFRHFERAARALWGVSVLIRHRWTGENFPGGSAPGLGWVRFWHYAPRRYTTCSRLADQKKTATELREASLRQKADVRFHRYGLGDWKCGTHKGDTTADRDNFESLLQRIADYVPAYLMLAQMW